MENHANQSPAIPKWSALLIEAVTKPGLIMKAYSAFHPYSSANQMLALLQFQRRGLQPGPLNTFPKWKELRPLRETWRTGADFVHADHLQTPRGKFGRGTHLYQLCLQGPLVYFEPDGRAGT